MVEREHVSAGALGEVTWGERVGAVTSAALKMAEYLASIFGTEKDK